LKFGESTELPTITTCPVSAAVRWPSGKREPRPSTVRFKGGVLGNPHGCEGLHSGKHRGAVNIPQEESPAGWMWRCRQGTSRVSDKEMRPGLWDFCNTCQMFSPDHIAGRFSCFSVALRTEDVGGDAQHGRRDNSLNCSSDLRGRFRVGPLGHETTSSRQRKVRRSCGRNLGDVLYFFSCTSLICRLTTRAG
jgi:hypothetical protein